MAYGLRIKDAAGNVLVNYDARLNRNRYAAEVAAAASNNTTLADTSGLTTAEFSIMVNPPTDMTVVANARYCQHSFVRSGTTFTWTKASSVSAYCSDNDSLIFSFFYN